jgi:uncharacterized membrane protein
MKSFPERLRTESAGWVGEGIVTESQREMLLARHPESEGGGRFVAILGTVGGGLLLAGVCLLIGANWQDIGDWVKIGGIVALIAGAYAAGWRLKVSPGNYAKTGDAFFMLGAGLLMAGIALVSQVFHLNARPATGVLCWWLGIVAVPWLVDSKGTQAVSLLAFLIWLGMEFTTQGSWLALTVSGRFTDELRMVAIMTVVGFAVWLAGLALRRTRYDDFAPLHEKWGLLMVCGGLYVMSFMRHIWRWHDDAGAVALPALMVVASMVVLAIWGAWKSSRKDVLAMAGWFVLALVPTGALLAGWNLGDHGWLWSAWSWSGLFVLNVFMIRTGLATGREGWVNLALAFIALNIVTRYFDLFGTMLEGGVFFVVSGVIVLTLGIYLERKRRGWLKSMRAQKEVTS